MLRDTEPGGGEGELVNQVLGAATHPPTLDVLLEPLAADQLRALVTTLVQRITARAAPVTETVPVGPAELCQHAILESAKAFGTTPEAIVSDARQQVVSDARAVAMTVARHAGLSYPAIGVQFAKDHASVMHAVRRTEQRPRLAYMAARISDFLDDRYTRTLPAAADLERRPSSAPSVASTPSDPVDLVQQAIAATAQLYEVTPADLMGADRSRRIGDARAVAMTAARMRGQSLPAIARHFDRDHTTVLHATRRIQKTPPLRCFAEQIAAGLPEAESDPEPGTQDWGTVTPPSSGVANSRREPDQPRQPAQRLRIAR